VGKRLCSQSEFTLSCGGAGGQSYPYGVSYNANTCNGVDSWPQPEDASMDTAGGNPGCVREDVYDLSGNLEEWVIEQSGQGVICGGGYLDPASELTCSACSSDSQTQVLDMRGFRCCDDLDLL
jgi:formylglycine-generating enzyme required for sulfatase activity